MTELFDKKYVYFMWDKEFEEAQKRWGDKKVFFGDSIAELKEIVNDGSLLPFFFMCDVKCSEVSDTDLYPFYDDVSNYKFLYCDPNYEVKLAYYFELKTIQFKLCEDGEWHDLKDKPSWDDDIEYRVKIEESKLMSFRQLAEWLAKGNGQYVIEDNIYTGIQYNNRDNDNVALPERCKVRRWNSDEWIEPTVEVYEADVHNN